MADVQKPVEVAPVDVHQEINTLLAESQPVEQTVAEPAAPVVPVQDAAVEHSTPAESAPVEAEEAIKSDINKSEAEPIEEGHLSHKAQGLSFPKNLIPSKEFFFFGSEPVEPRSLSAYRRNEKSTSVAQSNIAWASHTGKGLLFLGEKNHPSGIINLSDASGPETDGAQKFHLTSNGNKHTFKAANTAERDNWVSQLKLKMAEAKEMPASVTESNQYKSTLESFKPVPAAAPTPKTEAPVIGSRDEEVAKTEETPKTDDVAKEELTTEEPKRRSASRKRASFFGFSKKEEKKEETKADETPVAAAVTEPAAEPAAENVAPTTLESQPVEAVPTATEDNAVEDVQPVEEAREKPSKRNSFFGGVFSKNQKKAVETKPEESTEASKEDAVVPTNGLATEETAPVIPPVETTTPLSADVSSPATVPAEVIEIPTTNGETKKDTREKRKSSLPFNFGKREKSPSPVEGEEKSGKGTFSKLRATINRKSSAPKAEEKPVEDVNKTEPTEAAPAEIAPAEPAQTPALEPENKTENMIASAPVVTASA